MPQVNTSDDRPMCTGDRSADGIDWRAMVAPVARQSARTLQAWLQRGRQRNVLAGLDDRLLKDIGLSQDEALREAAKPFWRP